MRLARNVIALSRRTTRRVRGYSRRGARTRSVAAPSTMRPIFVGGTGRSGTTITSGLLGRHPDLKRLRTETKFISSTGGLCDLVEGRTTVERFERRLYDQWFDRGEAKGLKVILERADIDAALAHLRTELDADPYAAAGAFAHRLLDPLAAAGNQRGWIEMTPSAALEGRRLLRMFPDMKLLHMVRDGRDVACSLLRMTWGPNDLHGGLDWWAERLERAFAACESLPADRVLVVRLEDLVVHGRDREYARILAFLDLDDAPRMRAFFDTQMPAEAMHAARWRGEVPPAMLPAFEDHYRRIVERLERLGYSYRAEPDEVVASA